LAAELRSVVVVAAGGDTLVRAGVRHRARRPRPVVADAIATLGAERDVVAVDVEQLVARKGHEVRMHVAVGRAALVVGVHARRTVLEMAVRASRVTDDFRLVPDVPRADPEPQQRATARPAGTSLDDIA